MVIMKLSPSPCVHIPVSHTGFVSLSREPATEPTCAGPLVALHQQRQRRLQFRLCGGDMEVIITAQGREQEELQPLAVTRS